MGSVEVVKGDAAATASEMHLVPCEIMHTGQAPVSVFFKPKPVEAAPEEREATFRGRRLRGRIVQPPPGYKGAVLADTRDASVADDEERRWLYKRSFDSFTLWQHDDLPHDEEPVLKSMRWARIASVLAADCEAVEG